MSDDPTASQDPEGVDDLPELLGELGERDAEATPQPSDEATTPMLPDPGPPGI